MNTDLEMIFSSVGDPLSVDFQSDFIYVFFSFVHAFNQPLAPWLARQDTVLSLELDRSLHFLDEVQLTAHSRAAIVELSSCDVRACDCTDAKCLVLPTLVAKIPLQYFVAAFPLQARSDAHIAW